MAQITKATNSMTLKLVIDNLTNRVLFGEAKKDFVDFLFKIPSLPLGNALSLLDNNVTKDKQRSKPMGSLGNLYKSIEKLDPNSFSPRMNDNKDCILLPFNQKSLENFFLRPNPNSCETKYLNDTYYSYFSNKEETDKFYYRLPYGGLVNPSLFMIRDDLKVEPLSFSAFFKVIDEYGAADELTERLEEREVNIGAEEGMALLKASMESQSVLTTVFIDKGQCRESRFEYYHFDSGSKKTKCNCPVCAPKEEVKHEESDKSKSDASKSDESDKSKFNSGFNSDEYESESDSNSEESDSNSDEPQTEESKE